MLVFPDTQPRIKPGWLSTQYCRTVRRVRSAAARSPDVLCPAAQATVTCTEVMAVGDNTGRILATNVFERQGGQWKVRQDQGPDLRIRGIWRQHGPRPGHQYV